MEVWGDLGHSETGSGETVGRVKKNDLSFRLVKTYTL